MTWITLCGKNVAGSDRLTPKPKHHQRLAQVLGIAQQRRGRRQNWQDGNLIEFAAREKISSWTGNEKSHVVKLRKKRRGGKFLREIKGGGKLMGA